MLEFRPGRAVAAAASAEVNVAIAEWHLSQADALRVELEEVIQRLEALPDVDEQAQSQIALLRDEAERLEAIVPSGLAKLRSAEQSNA